jgi:hypothetical protein
MGDPLCAWIEWLEGIELDEPERGRLLARLQRQAARVRSLGTELAQAEAAVVDALASPRPLGPRDLAPRVRTITTLQREILEAGLSALLALREVVPRERLRAAFEIGERPPAAGVPAGN